MKGVLLMCGVALAADGGLGRERVPLKQPFDALGSDITVAASSGAERLSVSVEERGPAASNRCFRVSWRSLKENGAVELAWRFPPTGLAERKFLFWVKPVKPVSYFTLNVLDESGRRIERHTWYGFPAGGWRVLKWWGGAKTHENSFESDPGADSARASCIVFRPGGGAGAECELEIDRFEEEDDLLEWLIRERVDRRGEGSRE